MDNREHLKDRKKAAWDTMLYSYQRMDLLVIAISGAAIWLILETLKYSTDHVLPNLCIIKLAGIAFCTAIISNFGSQMSAQKCTEYEFTSTSKELLFKEQPTENQTKEIALLNTKTDIFNNLTGWLNTASVILMFAGLILTMYYFLSTF